MDELQQGMFGPIYTQFKGKPKEAIKFLRQQKQGERPASLHRDDIGDIDIVWGEVTDPVKHKGFGLSHIIDKHEAELNHSGLQVQRFLRYHGNEISYSNIHESSPLGRSR